MNKYYTPKEAPKRRCIVCNKVFYAHRRKVCSDKCWKIRDDNYHKIYSKDYYADPENAKKMKATAKKHHLKNRNIRGKVNQPCEFCKKTFLSISTIHKFCSRKCRKDAFWEKSPITKKEYNKQLYQKIRIPVTKKCKKCGNKFISRNGWAHCDDCKKYSKYIPKEEEIAKCLECNTLYKRKRSRKFCCFRCRKKYNYDRKIRRPIVKRICDNKECGKEFETRRKNKRCCSKECYPRSRRIEPVKNNCKMCGNDFLGAKGRIFCSKVCGFKFHNNKHLKQKIKRKCKNSECDNIIISTGESKKFCSKKCSYKFFNAKHRKQPVKKTCIECNKIFFSKHSNRMVCSFRCGQIINNRKHLKQPVKKICIYCSKTFMTVYDRKILCSRICKDKNTNKKRRELTKLNHTLSKSH